MSKLLISNHQIENLAKKRIEICVYCENFRDDNVCKLCDCYMPDKVRNPKSRCVIGKWL